MTRKLVKKSEHHGDKAGRDQRNHGLIDDAMQRHQPGGIGADAEEGGVAERDDAGIAQDQVEREREQGQPNNISHDQVARRKQERAGQRQHPEHNLARLPACAGDGMG